MERPITPGDRPGPPGYVLIILMMAIFVMTLGLLVAVPVWQTELQREREEELIFRGRQYAEAVRIYVQKNPGRYPESLKELLDKKCIRRLYRDPFGRDGRWNVVLASGRAGGLSPSRQGDAGGSVSGTAGGSPTATPVVQEVLVAPERALTAIKSPRILGVVSSSTAKSIKIYNDQESHDKWLFFFGLDPQKPPKVVYYGQDDRD